TTVDVTPINRLARLTSSGSVDATFVPGAGPDGPVNVLALQGDGRLIVGGYFNTYNGVPRANLVRLHANGDLDGTFSQAGPNSSVTALAVQPDGKIFLGGGFNGVANQLHPFFARLTTNGLNDGAFFPDAGA